MQLGEAKNSGISLDFSRNCKKTLGKPAVDSKNLEEIQEKYPMMGLICVGVVYARTTSSHYHILAYNLSVFSESIADAANGLDGVSFLPNFFAKGSDVHIDGAFEDQSIFSESRVD